MLLPPESSLYRKLTLSRNRLVQYTHTNSSRTLPRTMTLSHFQQHVDDTKSTQLFGAASNHRHMCKCRHTDTWNDCTRQLRMSRTPGQVGFSVIHFNDKQMLFVLLSEQSNY